MTLDEAQIVASIAATADDGCSYCVRDLLLQLQQQFPQFTWQFKDGQATVTLAEPPEAGGAPV